MSLAKKLNLKPEMKARVVGKPAGVDLSDVAVGASAAEAVIAFFAWIAYPKAGKLDSDLNRDILWRHLLKKGVQAVRQVALDNVWSAMRFRPAGK